MTYSRKRVAAAPLTALLTLIISLTNLPTAVLLENTTTLSPSLSSSSSLSPSLSSTSTSTVAIDPRPPGLLEEIIKPENLTTTRVPPTSATLAQVEGSTQGLASTQESTQENAEPPRKPTNLLLPHKSLFKWNSVISGEQNSLTYMLNCTPDSMTIEVNLTGYEQPFVYLEKLKTFSICRPKIVKSIATFHLSLEDDFYRCGTIKVHDQLSGTRIYYNRVIVESKKTKEIKSVYFKCSLPSLSKLLERGPSSSSPQRRKRQLSSAQSHPGGFGPGELVNFTEVDLPDNFMEAEILDLDGNITAKAPYPELGIRVKKNGELVNTTLNVAPGTPLEMIIYLDDQSKHVYGLMATFMKVTDNLPGMITRSNSPKEEVIVLNGCSIDPYIFGNFETEDNGDSVGAKFRAFKFPESSYVMFVGTVNVCLDKCLGVPCGNDIVAYGKRRRRRSIPTDLPKDPNKVFEVEMVTYLQIGYTQAELDAKIQRPSSLQSSYSQNINTRPSSFKPARLTSSNQHQPISSKLYDANGSGHAHHVNLTFAALFLAILLQRLIL